MSERKHRVLLLTLISSILLVLGLLAYLNTGDFLWLVPGIIIYIINIVYYLKKPAHVVWDETEESDKP